MHKSENVTAAVLIIGDEILSGRTKDRNIGILADHLTGIGIRLIEVRIIRDDVAAIAAAITALKNSHTYVFTTGGIGPTHDDVTAEAVAKAFGVGLPVDPRAVALMQPFYGARGIPLAGARLRMARIPEGAQLIENPVSAAPGFWIGNVLVFAGIPDVLSAMLAQVTPRLKTGARMLSISIAVSRPEGDIADILAAHQQQYPEIAMGSYPVVQEGRYATELVLRATDQRTLEQAARELREKLSTC